MVLQDGIRYCPAHFLLSLLRIEVLTFVPIGEKSGFHQYTGHKGLVKDDKPCLFDLSILAFKFSGESILHHFAQQNTLIQKLFLHNGQADDGFRGVNVVIGIARFIIILQVNHRILFFSHFKILCIGMKSQNESSRPIGVGRMGIAMN